MADPVMADPGHAPPRSRRGGRTPLRVAARAGVLLILLTLGVLAAPGRAADDAPLDLVIDDATAYASLPFVARLVVEGTDVTIPSLPADGEVRFLGAPTVGRSQSTYIVNGRLTRSSSVTYTFELIADEPGLLVIPSIQVRVDGRDRVTRPRSILVRRLDGAGVLEAEILSDRSRVFLGEPIELRLRLRIRRFEDEALRYQASLSDTFSWIDARASRLGPFGDGDGRGQRAAPRTLTEIERDADGSTWFVFERRHQMRPETTGPLTIEPVTILLRYPNRLERTRDFFRRDTLSIVDERLAMAVAQAPEVTVAAPPVEGRPPHFRGAVGRFSISASAEPREAAVGDPITLTLTIRDASGRTADGLGADLDALAPPPLAEIGDLAEDFRIPTDPLAGTVTPDGKVFVQTIRARRQDVRRIPPIPLVFFDPQEGRYVTVHTEPVPLSIARSESAGDEVIESAAGPAAPRRLVARDRGGPRPIVVDADRLLAATPALPSAAAIGTGAALPPLLALAMLLARRRRQGAMARRRARQRRAIAEARRRLGGDRVLEADATSVLCALVAALADRPAASVTGAEAADVLRDLGADGTLAAAVRAAAEAGDRRRYAGPGAAEDDAAHVAEVRALVERIAEAIAP